MATPFSLRLLLISSLAVFCPATSANDITIGFNQTTYLTTGTEVGVFIRLYNGTITEDVALMVNYYIIMGEGDLSSPLLSFSPSSDINLTNTSSSASVSLSLQQPPVNSVTFSLALSLISWVMSDFGSGGESSFSIKLSPKEANVTFLAPANCIPECENGGACTKNSICLCAPGWSGGRCQTAECFPECENGGTCTGPGVCQCPQGWSRIRCSTAECVPRCQNGGNCSKPNVCKCSLGWSGNSCQTAVCSQGCDNGGGCIIPGVCLCQEGWFGRRCEKAAYLGSFPCQPVLTVGFSNKNTSVNEDNGVVTLVVEIQCGLLLVNQSFVVTLTLIDGSGSVGLDYKSLTAELVFNRTLTKHTVNVSLINDDVTEQSETFFARLMLMSPLHESRNILLSPNQIEVEIEDDDRPVGPVVGFAVTYYTASEDDGFVIVTVAVLLGTIELGDTISLVFTTQENNASAGVDYKTTRQDVMLTSGQGSKVEISIQIIDDDITESTESFSGHLMLLSSSRNVSVSSIRAEVVIKDNDNLTIGFVPTSYATIEGVGLVVMNVAVLKGTIGTTVTLEVSTNDITSIARKDFEPLTNAQLTISPKRSLATIAVRILNDNIRENWEAFTAHVSLVSPLSDRINIGPADAVVLIVNDD